MHKKFVFAGILALVLTVNPSFSMIDSLSSNNVIEKNLAASPISEKNPCKSPSLALARLYLHEYGENIDPRKLIIDFFNNPRFNLIEPGNDCVMGDQQIHLDETLIDIICGFTQFEQKESARGNVVLYHGCDGNYLFLCKYFAKLFSAASGRNYGDVMLRWNPWYMINSDTGRPFDSINQAREHFKFNEDQYGGTRDYGGGVENLFLRANMALTVGPTTSRSTASSVGFFCNSFSVKGEKFCDFLMEELILRGVPIDVARNCADEVKQLFKEFYPENCGGLLAISVPWDKIDDVALNVDMGGRKDRYAPSLKQALQRLQHALEAHESNEENLKTLTNEVSLYVDPRNNFETYGEFRYSLSPEKQKEFDAKFGTIINKHLGIISHHRAPSFIMNDFSFWGKQDPLINETCSPELVPLMIDRGFQIPFEQMLKQIFDKSLGLSWEDGNFEKIKKMSVGNTIKRVGWQQFLSFTKGVELIFGNGRSFLESINTEDQPLIFGKLRDFCCRSNRMTGNIAQKISFLISTIKDQRLRKELFVKFINFITDDDSFMGNSFNKEKIRLISERGFNLNPTDPNGEYDLLQEYLMQNGRFNDCLQIAKCYFDYYAKNPQRLKDLYMSMYAHGYSPENFTPYNGLYTECLSEENDSDFFNRRSISCDIPIKNINNLDLYLVKYGDDEASLLSASYQRDTLRTTLGEYTKAKFDREYSHRIIDSYSDFKLKYFTNGNSTNIIYKPESGQLWLSSLKKLCTKEQSFDQKKIKIREMVEELDDLDVLFFNLKLIDEILESSTNETDTFFLELLESCGSKHDEFMRNIKSPNADKPLLFQQARAYSLVSFIRNADDRQYENFTQDDWVALSKNCAKIWKYNPQFDFYLFQLKGSISPHDGKILMKPSEIDFAIRLLTDIPQLFENRTVINGFSRSEELMEKIASSDNKDNLLKTMDTWPQGQKEFTISKWLQGENITLKKFAIEAAKSLHFERTNIPLVDAINTYKSYFNLDKSAEEMYEIILKNVAEDNSNS